MWEKLNLNKKSRTYLYLYLLFSLIHFVFDFTTFFYNSYKSNLVLIFIFQITYFWIQPLVSKIIFASFTKTYIAFNKSLKSIFIYSSIIFKTYLVEKDYQSHKNSINLMLIKLKKSIHNIAYLLRYIFCLYIFWSLIGICSTPKSSTASSILK